MEIMETCGSNSARTAGVLLPRCHFCGQVPEKGIRGGIRVRKAFICEQCESHIVSLQAGCNEYRYLLEELRRIW